MRTKRLPLKGELKDIEAYRDMINEKINKVLPRKDFLSSRIKALNDELYDLDDSVLSLTNESNRVTGYIAEMNENDCNCYKIDKEGEITYYKVYPGRKE